VCLFGSFHGARGLLEGLQTNFAKPNAYPVDGRGVGYSIGYFNAKHLGGRPILPDDHSGISVAAHARGC